MQKFIPRPTLSASVVAANAARIAGLRAMIAQRGGISATRQVAVSWGLVVSGSPYHVARFVEVLNGTP